MIGSKQLILDLPVFVPSYMNDNPNARKSAGKRPYIATVIMAQNRAGRKIHNVTTLYPRKLPIGVDGTHYSSEGYIKLGKTTVTSVEEFYKAEKLCRTENYIVRKVTISKNPPSEKVALKYPHRGF